LRKSRNKAELKFFSREKLRDPDIFLPVLIFFISYLIKSFLFTSFAFTYDEIAYSATAQDLAHNGGWFNFSNSTDLFFFPPLFNWLSGLLVSFGTERVIAVRTVTMVFSSAIVVAIYFILRNYGLSARRALTGPVLWTMIPGVLFYGTVGQVEIPFLFFVLLSILLIQKEQRLRNIILSSFFLACGVWIKETAIGFAPVLFLVLAMEKDRKRLLLWTGSFVLFCLPLLLRSFFSEGYGLFYELSNDLISWGNISFLSPFRNLLSLLGFFSFSSWIDITALVLCILFVVSVNVYALLKKNCRLIRVLVISNAIFLIFFIIFPKKFDYYLLGILLFTLIVTVTVFSKSRIVMTLLAVILTALSIEGLHYRGSNWDRYFEAVRIITNAAKEDPGTTIGTTFPETVRYIAEKNSLDIKVADIPFTGPQKKTCMNEPDRCITKYDYFFTDDLFFVVLFCRTWPIQKENCDIEAMKRTFSQLEKVEITNYFSLYQVINREERNP